MTLANKYRQDAASCERAASEADNVEIAAIWSRNAALLRSNSYSVCPTAPYEGKISYVIVGVAKYRALQRKSREDFEV